MVQAEVLQKNLPFAEAEVETEASELHDEQQTKDVEEIKNPETKELKASHVLPIKTAVYRPRKPDIAWFISTQNKAGVYCRVKQRQLVNDSRYCQVRVEQSAILHRDGNYEEVPAGTILIVDKRNLIKNS